jgi:phospholipid/cholesterol/gamma-HCH transport system substrate-binding protein
LASPTNHWKLGLFVVSGVVLALSAVVVLGAQSLKKQTIPFITFFDESVQGLDVGSPVKFRGVVIGTVSDINIAPDRRHVETVSDVETEALTRLGLFDGKPSIIHAKVPPGLRVQLASAGITGVKFLQMDFFPEKDNPPPRLPFPTPPNYVPAAVSMMKNVEDAITRAMNRVPEVADNILIVTARLDRILADVEGRHFTQQAETVLNRADRVLGRIDGTLSDLQTDKLSARAQGTLENIDGVTNRMSVLLDRTTAQDGLFMSAQRASDAVGDAARNATGIGTELDETLRAVQEAAGSIQKLADALELDSDMLLKGRARRPR